MIHDSNDAAVFGAPRHGFVEAHQTLTFVRLRAAPVLFVGATARAVVVGADRFLPALATRLLPAPRWPAILNDAREGKTVTGGERFRLLTVLAGRRATRSSIIVIVASRTEALSSAGWRPVACLLSRNGGGVAQYVTGGVVTRAMEEVQETRGKGAGQRACATAGRGATAVLPRGARTAHAAKRRARCAPLPPRKV